MTDDYELWSSKQCAEYFGQCRKSFLTKTATAEGFPEPCAKPGHPRWLARDVKRWAARELEAA